MPSGCRGVGEGGQQDRRDAVEVEARVERVASDVCGERGQGGVLCADSPWRAIRGGDQSRDIQVAKGALIDEQEEPR